ncbi:MAG TPA: type II secretion system F family protein [Chromatiaceae bacterium]|nr:type II secretion system F family protein [Chromatiaceae bacterium]
MQILIISLIFGALIALIVWNVYRIFAVIPEEDRSYLDRPPLGFRLTWPLIKGFVHYFGFLVSQNYRMVTLLRLRRAGLDYMLSPEQFFAGKVVAAFAAVAFVYLLQNMLDKGSIMFLLLAAIAGFYYPELWLKEATDNRNRKIFRELPFYLDIIILSVEAGTNFTGGLTQAVNKAPDGPLRQEFSRVLRDVRAGKPRAESLRELSERVGSDGINSVVSTIIQAEKTGSSLGAVLKAQADQLRTTRFLKAEKMAMEAPVKLLGPLIMFIFPNTFLIIIFVMLSNAIQKGVLSWPPLVWAFNWPGG